jgi:hypothetical protein
MSRVNRKDKKDFGRPNQLDLWEDLSFDPTPHLKTAMRDAIKQSPLSREQIIDQITDLAERAGIIHQPVTVDVLNKWTAPGSTSYMIPLKLLPIFCRVTGSNLPLEVFSKAFLGCRVISGDDYNLLQWARAETAFRQARAKARKLAKEIGVDG